MPTAIEIGGLALIVALLAFAQRLGGWEHKTLARCLGVTAVGLVIAWCFLFLPAWAGWGAAAVGWSVCLWFLCLWTRHPTSAVRQLPSVTLLTLQGTTLDPRCPPNQGITYTAKVRAVFTNTSAEMIHVLAPSWTTGVGDVPVQHEFGYRYQIEAALGSWRHDRWRLDSSKKAEELLDAYVEPGWSCRVYIGLDPTVPHADLEKRRSSRRLGTLIIPMKIGRNEYKWQQRI